AREVGKTNRRPPEVTADWLGMTAISSIAGPAVGPGVAYPLDRADVTHGPVDGAGVVLQDLGTVTDVVVDRDVSGLDVQVRDQGAVDVAVTIHGDRTAHQNHSLPGLERGSVPGQVAG